MPVKVYTFTLSALIFMQAACTTMDITWRSERTFQPLEDDAPVTLLAKEPDTFYYSLARLEYRNPWGSTSWSELKAAVSRQARSLGGNAVIMKSRKKLDSYAMQISSSKPGKDMPDRPTEILYMELDVIFIPPAEEKPDGR